MLKVSPAGFAAHEREAAQRRRQRYLQWLTALGGIVGPMDRDRALFGLDSVAEEAARAEIDEDERLFAYALARTLMPGMTGAQYMWTMDVVFSPHDAAAKARALIDIRDRADG